MAIETEIKLRVGSHEPVRSRLRELVATPLGQFVERNRVLDRSDGSLRGSGCGLRLRSSCPVQGGSPSSTVTFKGPVRPSVMKSREEIEFGVADFDSAAELFERLGFVPVLIYEKRRESWALGDCRIELDEPPGIGLFVEIEGPDESTILRVQRDLSLGDAPLVRESYVRLLVSYCDSRGIVPRIVPLARPAG